MYLLRFLKAVFFALIGGRSLHGHLRFWVTPLDCDINWHLNNANYLKLMDIGRYDYFIRSGMMRVFVREKYRPAAVKVDIDFKRSIPPGTFITLDTKIVGATTKSFLMQQTFHVGSQVAADAKVVFVVTHRGKTSLVQDIAPSLDPGLQKTVISS